MFKGKEIHLPEQKIFNDIHSIVYQPPVERISMIQSMLSSTWPLSLYKAARHWGKGIIPKPGIWFGKWIDI